MSEFDKNVREYRRKKQNIIQTQKTEETGIKRTGLISNAPVEKERKQTGTTDAYRKILAADFDSEAWISKEQSLRKHRKNINANYKSLTGRKSGLSSQEKLQRKKDFEDRRDISLRASTALGEFIEGASGVDPDPSDEGVLKLLEETDLSIFTYGGGSGAQKDIDCDAEFVQGFAEKMKALHQASLLYNKLMQGNIDSMSPALLSKLSQMNDMRQAYEDRIRIISSPYYVSLREVDFDQSTKDKLWTGEDDEKRSENLKDYAKSMLRWQESGKKLLSVKQGAGEAAPAEQEIHNQNVLMEGRVFVSDQAVDKVIGKINGKTKEGFGKMVNGDHDLAMTYTREWVYKDLKKKADPKKMLHEVDRMKERLRKELAEGNPEETKRRSITKVVQHLERVSNAFAARKISPEAMRVWLDRCLMHKLNYSGEIYLNLVHQGKTKLDEENYFDEAKKVIDPYVQQMSGVIFAQSTFLTTGVYQKKADLAETKDPAILRSRRGCKNDKEKRIKKLHEFSGMGHMSINDQGTDFIHISGKNADYNDITARAYVSAKPQYKSLVLRLFTETVAEFENKNMRDELYFKISSEKNRSRGYAADDLTIYLGSNVSMEERKQLLDKFYEKCSKVSAEKGESILDGDNMVIAGSKYKDGIALAGEPDIATLLNLTFANADKSFFSTFSDRGRLKKMRNMSSDQIKEKYSFNTFVVAMLVQSTFVAGKRLKKKLTDEIDVNDPKVREEIKKIFRELCFLNGINPENMADIDNTSALG